MATSILRLPQLRARTGLSRWPPADPPRSGETAGDSPLPPLRTTDCRQVARAMGLLRLQSQIAPCSESRHRAGSGPLVCLQCAYMKTARFITEPFGLIKIGRDDRIRTCDPLTPSHRTHLFQETPPGTPWHVFHSKYA